MVDNNKISTDSEPQSIIEAADSTADKDVLAQLWELTKHRINEEKGRQDGARDRASKYITYGFSILASAGGVLVLARDLIKDAFVLNQCWAVALLGMIAVNLIIILAVVALKC